MSRRTFVYCSSKSKKYCLISHSQNIPDPVASGMFEFEHTAVFVFEDNCEGNELLFERTRASSGLKGTCVIGCLHSTHLKVSLIAEIGVAPSLR
jgi:hypothetical protein